MFFGSYFDDSDDEPAFYDYDYDYDYDDYDDQDYDYSNDNDVFPYRPQEQTDQQAVYKGLHIPNPNHLENNPLPLIDICASMIALNFPFACIEDRNPPIPENVLLKIFHYSFPQQIEKIKRYCSLNHGSSAEFDKAVRIVKSVKDLTQIGFHLSANVECLKHVSRLVENKPFLYITIKFDRGKITEANCPCESTSSWCFHVIAVCLARITLPNKCVVKPPLSDSLNNLTSYAQLRTFTQYLITEFSNQRIVESAQNILDRMLGPETADLDAINETWGAPDPTAGPGSDETSQWLICEESLKCRCISLLQHFDLTEGRGSTVVGDLFTSVIEIWKSSQIRKPVIDDYFDNLENIPGSVVYSYNQYAKSYSRENGQDITTFLKTCEDLLRDDFSYSLKAVQTFTAQLADIIEKRNERSYMHYDTDRADIEKFESNFHLGCIPRPQTCWLFRDQLARLWRLLVLNPSISAKKCEEIFTILENFETKQHSTRAHNKKRYAEWVSQEHVRKLENFTWEKLQLAEDAFKDDGQVSVLRSTLVRHSKVSAKIAHTEQFPYPVDLICGEFCSSVTVFCYLIEALSVYGKKEQAVHLAMNIALAIVKFYESWCCNEGRLNIGIKTTLCVDSEDEMQSASDTGKKKKRMKKVKKKRQKGKRESEGTKKVKEANEESKNKLDELFDQVEGIIPITSIAYLLDILQQNQELLAEMLKLVKLTGLGLYGDDLMVYGDVTDAQSLIFCLGVIGVAMPKIQAPSLQIQVEWFNWEVYISEKIMQFTPSSGDVGFLEAMTSRMIHLCHLGFHPPYALVMNLFQHSYKPESSHFDGNGKPGLSVALETVVALPWKLSGVHINRRIFLESLRRHWVKLCEIVLCQVSVSSTDVSHSLECLFTATAMIGSTSEDLNIKVDKKTSSRDLNSIEKIVANLYLAYVLASHADGLKTATDVKSSERIPMFKQKQRTGFDEGEVTVAEGKTTSNREQRELLYETAITLASRAFAVKNVAKLDELLTGHCGMQFRDFMQRSLKWMCDISNVIGLKAIEMIFKTQFPQFGIAVKCFSDDEVIKICTIVLKSEQKHEDRVWLRVRDALLTLAKPQSHNKISDILSVCRNVEKESSSKRVLLVPAICKKLLTYIPGSSLAKDFKVEHLTNAMMAMFTLIKKLKSEDEEDNLEGLRELFSETSISSTDQPGTSQWYSGGHETLDPNLQLCFDLAMEIIRHCNIDDNDRYQTKQRFRNICNVVAFVATRSTEISSEQSAEAVVVENAKTFEDVFLSRFIEVLCNQIKDFFLLSDILFELASQLLGMPHQGSFGHDGVHLSDDCKIAVLCQSCSSLSGLLKRCKAGLLATTHGEMMNNYLKETRLDTYSMSIRAKHAKFYCGASLVSVLEVLKRLMSVSQEDEFETFSNSFSSKHPFNKYCIEQLSTERPRSPRTCGNENILAQLLLRQMFGLFHSIDYDSDDEGWRY